MVELPARGRTGKFCSNACKQKAWRARQPKVKRLPREVRHRRVWTRAEGKRPFMCDGRPASTTNPGTWSTFRSVGEGYGDGFGMMLGGGVACHDLDHCIADGCVEAWALDVVRGIPDEDVLFIERSVSGGGLHVFVRSPERGGWRRGRHEFYSEKRFIRVTGDLVTKGDLMSQR